MKHLIGSLLLIATQAGAHEGHGLPGASHWHANDAYGFVVLAVVLAIAIWLTRRK